MSTRTLLISAALLLAPAASAQQVRPSLPTYPITAPVRDGGTLHLATHTWTRHAPQSALSPAVIYDNTCSVPHFEGLSATQTLTDEGRVPSPTSPPTPTVSAGCNQAYFVDGFQIAYCTDQLTIDAHVAFVDSYASCTSAVGLPTAAAFALNGLPGTTSTLGCWIVTIDLESPPQSTSLGFELLADGDGSFGGPTADTFGFEFSMPHIATGSMSGPFLAGNPNTCPEGAGTVWSTNMSSGTGLGTLNQFRIDDTAGPSFCATLGPQAFASIHLRLYSPYPCVICSCNVACAGDGSGVPCPCGNNSPILGRGCTNSVMKNAQISGTGNPSLSNDTVHLFGSDMTPSSSVLYFQGTTVQNSGMGSPFGDGKRCAGGSVVRLGIKANVNGASIYPGSGDPSVSARGGVTQPGTRIYQAWYRDQNPTFCTSGLFNLSNGIQVSWVP